MFGYIKPLKPEMKIREFEVYNSIYCGLCKQLGKSFGFFSKFTLNYDFVFLAMLSLSLCDDEPCFDKCSCLAHPFKKKTCIKSSKHLEFCADVANIFVYYKLLDNIKDKKHIFKIPYYIVYPFFSISKNKSSKRLPEIDNIVSDMITKQFSLEAKSSNSIDEAAEPTAIAISKICKTLSSDHNQSRVLERFGYILGRWIYLIDAFDDLRDDYKNENYNVFILKYNIEKIDEQSILTIYNNIIDTMNLNLGELSSAYSLLDIKKFKPILDNIVYLGLKSAQNQILNESKRNINISLKE